MPRYDLRPRARQDLAGIWEYTASHWSFEQADTYYGAIQSALKSLSQNPMLGQLADLPFSNLRKSGVGSHLIFYSPTDYGIDVVRILHGAMDLPGHLED